MEANEYFENLEKAMVGGNKPQPMPDEVVWLELVKAWLTIPPEAMKSIGNCNITVYQMADKGLEEFKQRFRNG